MVDEAVEDGPALDPLPGEVCGRVVRPGRAELAAAVGASPVVVPGVPGPGRPAGGVRRGSAPGRSPRSVLVRAFFADPHLLRSSPSPPVLRALARSRSCPVRAAGCDYGGPGGPRPRCRWRREHSSCRRFGSAGPGPGSLARGTHVRQLQLPPDNARHGEHHGRLPPVTPGHLGRRRRLIPVSALNLHLQLKTSNRFLEIDST